MNLQAFLSLNTAERTDTERAALHCLALQVNGEIPARDDVAIASLVADSILAREARGAY
ncbi:MAG: hypothetical protein LAT65_16540 [Saccharospirillum sp.]|nr:hypothetical protein [Saccharospirillum sp.]